MPRIRLLPALLATTLALLPAASRAEKLIVGKTTPHGFAWMPADVAEARGFFKRDGLDIELLAFNGGAKLHQAMVSGAVDVGLGSGTDFGFLLKGAPEKAVADMADRVLDIGVTVAPSVKTVDDLRGARIGVSAPASLTWLVVLQLNHLKGWTQGGAIPVAVGGNWPAFTAALETGQVKAVVSDPALGFQLGDAGKARLLLPAAEVMGAFNAHAIYATDKAIATKRAEISKFLAGWFEAVRWMRSHRDEAIAFTAESSGIDQVNATRSYDLIMPMFLEDGHFHAANLQGAAQALTELEMAEGTPDLTKYVDETMLPK